MAPAHDVLLRRKKRPSVQDSEDNGEERQDGEELNVYLLDVWPLITATTTNEVKRVQVSYVTSNPVGPEGMVPEH